MFLFRINKTPFISAVPATCAEYKKYIEEYHFVGTKYQLIHEECNKIKLKKRSTKNIVKSEKTRFPRIGKNILFSFFSFVLIDERFQ